MTELVERAVRRGGLRSVARRITSAVGRAAVRHPAVWLFVIFALLATASRIASLEVPLDRDAGVYLYVGETILQGGAPYTDAADSKGPLTFLLFALFHLVAGTSAEVVRLTLVAFMAIAAVALAGYVGRFAGRATGLLAGATLAVVGSTHRLEGDDPNTEQYGIAPMVAAWFLATGRTRLHAAVSGAAAAAAVCMNVGFAMVAPFVIFELWRGSSEGERQGRLLAAAGGAAAVAVPILAWLGLSGAWDDMRTQVLGATSQAIGGDLTAGRRRPLLQFPLAYLALAVTALGGCAAAIADRRLRPVALPVAAWIVVMTARVKLSSYGSGQFYFPAMPGIAAGLALGVAAVWAWAGRKVALTPVRRATIAAALLAIVTVLYVVQPQWTLLQRSPENRLESEDVSLRLAYPVSDFLRERTAPSEMVFVAGSDAEVYWLADRRAPTRFFHVFPLRLDPSYRYRRVRELNAQPPAAVVVLPGAKLRERKFFGDIEALVRRHRYRLAFEREGARVWLLRGSTARTRGSKGSGTTDIARSTEQTGAMARAHSSD